MDGLSARLARGDRAAFAELYDACADRLHRYLAVRLRSCEDADEVLQETFLRLVRTRTGLANVENLVAYVFTVARHEAARLANRRTRRRANQSGDTEGVLLCPAEGDEAGHRETVDLIAAALDRLDAKQREIVELKTYSGLTFREIAEVTRLPQGTVATRYRTALGRLRHWLQRELS